MSHNAHLNALKETIALRLEILREMLDGHKQATKEYEVCNQTISTGTLPEDFPTIYMHYGEACGRWTMLKQVIEQDLRLMDKYSILERLALEREFQEICDKMSPPLPDAQEA